MLSIPKSAIPTAPSSSGRRGIDVPATWSQVATDVLAQKYFRRAGVARHLNKIAEGDVPEWLWRSAPDETALAALPADQRYGGETSSRQVFHRMAGAWTYWGWKGGYFDSEQDARTFHDEHCFMLAAQICAPNSPQWFNTGLHWAYGIDGPGQGHWFVDHRDGTAYPSTSSYERPQPHACFIQGVSDDLVNEGGIMDLWVREARLFKYGSGTGSNFSRLRGAGEKLSGGGKSSGLMSFLKIGDRAAGAIKSGGTTRRAAKMVMVDVDHPDIEEFIAWKMLEEQKVAALVAGSRLANRHLNAIMQACLEGEGDDAFDPKKNPRLRREIVAARQAELPENYIQRVIQFARQGYRHIEFPAFDTDWQSEAYASVAGQNANNSVRVTDEFLRAVEADRDWALTERTTGKVAKTVERRRAVGPHRRGGLALGRSWRAVRYDHQRLAHLPRVRPHQCVEPVLGIHVPRRHGVQSRLAEPDAVPPGRRHARCRGPRARHPPVDHGARDLGDDGAVPVAPDRRALLSVPHTGPGLRQPRRVADGVRPGLRFRPKAAPLPAPSPRS